MFGIGMLLPGWHSWHLSPPVFTAKHSQCMNSDSWVSVSGSATSGWSWESSLGERTRRRKRGIRSVCSCWRVVHSNWFVRKRPITVREARGTEAIMCCCIPQLREIWWNTSYQSLERTSTWVRLNIMKQYPMLDAFYVCQNAEEKLW